MYSICIKGGLISDGFSLLRKMCQMLPFYVFPYEEKMVIRSKGEKLSEMKLPLTGGEFPFFCKSHTFFRHLNHAEGGGGVGRIVSDRSKMKGFNNDDV